MLLFIVSSSLAVWQSKLECLFIGRILVLPNIHVRLEPTRVEDLRASMGRLLDLLGILNLPENILPHGQTR